MKNIYLERPELFQHETTVEKVRRTDDDILCLAPSENIFRPAGGGQPQDRGRILIGATEAKVGRIFKEDGATWLALEDSIPRDIAPNELIRLRVDQLFRDGLSAAHTLVHLLMAAARNVVRGYESKGASISSDGRSLELRFRSDEDFTPDLLKQIDILGRYLIGLDRPVQAIKVRSMSDAAARFRQWRVDPDLGLSGKIRVIDIVGIDQNPCSGSHVASTAMVGPFELKGSRTDARGVTIVSVDMPRCWHHWYRDGVIESCSRVELAQFDLDEAG
jgi:Ser-tRNA(Ala) deacylase AlaX